MKVEDRDKIINNMIEVGKKVDSTLDSQTQTRGRIIHYADFKFKGIRLAAENVNIVEICTQKQRETEDNSDSKEDTVTDEVIGYQIYNKKNQLLATVTENGEIHFSEEYTQKIGKGYIKELHLEDAEFELPEELEKNDIAMTREELKEYEKQNSEKASDKGKEELEKEPEQENEKEKKEKTAQALGITSEEVKSVCTINPHEKITDKNNLVDFMPEAAEYAEISIVYSNSNNKGSGYFTILGVRKDGTREKLNSIESIEGATTTKDVISVNEDGTEVKEKQVKGLFRINAGSRMDGISVSVGDYGMLDIDYVSNVMDKEYRRATPIRTKETQNQRIATAKVRENAGDSKEEVIKEGMIFRKREKEDTITQSIDGIDIDQADGNSMTLEQLKKQIKEKVLEMGEMSRADTEEAIRTELYESDLELSEQETELATQDIRMQVLDESKFPTRDKR